MVAAVAPGDGIKVLENSIFYNKRFTWGCCPLNFSFNNEFIFSQLHFFYRPFYGAYFDLIHFNILLVFHTIHEWRHFRVLRSYSRHTPTLNIFSNKKVQHQFFSSHWFGLDGWKPRTVGWTLFKTKTVDDQGPRSAGFVTQKLNSNLPEPLLLDSASPNKPRTVGLADQKPRTISIFRLNLIQHIFALLWCSHH